MINKFPKLNLPPSELRLKNEDGVWLVWDNLRGSWLVATAEEWVRQNFIWFLTTGLGVIPQYITQERRVDLGGVQRADIVVYGRSKEPCLLVECKAADVKLDKSVLAQAMRYNSVHGAPYIIITNGLSHLCFEICGGQCKQMSDFPELGKFMR